MLGHRQQRPTVHMGSDSLMPSRMRRYTMPYSNSSNSSFRCPGEYGPSLPSRRVLQFMCIHSKWIGSMEFSWHWNQLHGTSANTICTKPLDQVNGSQVGTRGAGCGP